MPAPTLEDLSFRAYRRLKAAGLNTLEEVAHCTIGDLLALQGFGRRSLAEVREALAAVGLTLKKAPHTPRKPTQQRMTPEKLRRAVGLYRAGWSAKEIGPALGVSYQTVVNHLRRKIELRDHTERGERYRWRRKAREIQQEWMTAGQASQLLQLDKSHVCAQCRAGRFLGAFRLHDGSQSVWLIPRQSVEEYRKTHPPKSGGTS